MCKHCKRPLFGEIMSQNLLNSATGRIGVVGNLGGVCKGFGIAETGRPRKSWREAIVET
jgi:hypothetical protein